MMDFSEFVKRAREKTGYEASPKERVLPDGTRVIAHKQGVFAYMDIYKGLGAFDGWEIAATRGKQWRRTYAGRVNTENETLALVVYEFLKKALRQFPRDRPFMRGPGFSSEGGLTYTCVCRGNMGSFRNTERIVLDDGYEIYSYEDEGGFFNK